MTVPDFLALTAAHSKLHGQPGSKASPSRLTREEIRSLQDAMKRAEQEDTEWRAA